MTTLIETPKPKIRKMEEFRPFGMRPKETGSSLRKSTVVYDPRRQATDFDPTNPDTANADTNWSLTEGKVDDV